MRVPTASFGVLMLACAGMALAQATNPSDIRVTQRTVPFRIVETPPPSRCGVLNPPSIGNPPRSVYCGAVPPISDAARLNPAPTLTFEQQMQAARRGFAAMDLNHDGVISRQEWSSLEAQAMTPLPQRNRAEFKCQLDQDFRLIDSNHDGKITFAEYIADNFGAGRPAVSGCFKR